MFCFVCIILAIGYGNCKSLGGNVRLSAYDTSTETEVTFALVSAAKLSEGTTITIINPNEPNNWDFTNCDGSANGNIKTCTKIGNHAVVTIASDVTVGDPFTFCITAKTPKEPQRTWSFKTETNGHFGFVVGDAPILQRRLSDVPHPAHSFEIQNQPTHTARMTQTGGLNVFATLGYKSVVDQTDVLTLEFGPSSHTFKNAGTLCLEVEGEGYKLSSYGNYTELGDDPQFFMDGAKACLRKLTIAPNNLYGARFWLQKPNLVGNIGVFIIYLFNDSNYLVEMSRRGGPKLTAAGLVREGTAILQGVKPNEDTQVTIRANLMKGHTDAIRIVFHVLNFSLTSSRASNKSLYQSKRLELERVVIRHDDSIQTVIPFTRLLRRQLEKQVEYLEIFTKGTVPAEEDFAVVVPVTNPGAGDIERAVGNLKFEIFDGETLIYSDSVWVLGNAMRAGVFIAFWVLILSLIF